MLRGQKGGRARERANAEKCTSLFCGRDRDRGNFCGNEGGGEGGVVGSCGYRCIQRDGVMYSNC